MMKLRDMESKRLIIRLTHNGMLVYQGTFRNGLQHGAGIAYSLEDGNICAIKGLWVNGAFKN